ncbi:hypothetical protein K470DRAFT_296020 [Piedraia hortae CBS 480.64]|uniref:Uncharacterized protein n=1 Tax=Piedraia hortae CBS 480.64 TaxID=1314780 RepID=A0A6A7BV06_9PEZI|nr:hypothetical protein K470DRAFT_296020 [Piedraia hortae CBS 480.64]
MQLQRDLEGQKKKNEEIAVSHKELLPENGRQRENRDKVARCSDEDNKFTEERCEAKDRFQRIAAEMTESRCLLALNEASEAEKADAVEKLSECKRLADPVAAAEQTASDIRPRLADQQERNAKFETSGKRLAAGNKQLEEGKYRAIAQVTTARSGNLEVITQLRIKADTLEARVQDTARELDTARADLRVRDNTIAHLNLRK